MPYFLSENRQRSFHVTFNLSSTEHTSQSCIAQHSYCHLNLHLEAVQVAPMHLEYIQYVNLA